MGGIPLVPRQRMSVFAGTALRELPRRETPRTLREHRPEHLGDDVARLADDHGVAGAHVFERHLVLVVKGGHLHGRTADEDRFEHGERRGLALAADGHRDVPQDRRAFLGRELEGDRPTGMVRRRTEVGLERQVVDLDHDAVGLVVVVVAGGLRRLDVGDDRVAVGHGGDLRVHREPERIEELQRLGVTREGRPAVHVAELIGPPGEPARGGDRRVLLPQRSPRRCYAGWRSAPGRRPPGPR